jgi:heat-inducible transcriptional repressor
VLKLNEAIGNKTPDEADWVDSPIGNCNTIASSRCVPLLRALSGQRGGRPAASPQVRIQYRSLGRRAFRQLPLADVNLLKEPSVLVPTQPPALNPRDREILRDIVRNFIEIGLPVSSRTVAKGQRLGLSAATIRNTMADLEEAGYLSQPHSSAGRVPTEAGYHTYIESLMPARKIQDADKRRIDEHLPQEADSEELMARAGQVLSDLTHQIGIVLTPAVGDTSLRTLTLVPLSGARVLCVIVSTAGFVDHKVIELEAPIGREGLAEASNYLTDQFGGMTLRQARDELLRLMARERAQVDGWLAATLAAAQQALGAGPGADVLVEGTSAVLTQPELADVNRVRKLVEKFNNRAQLVTVLNQLIKGRGVRVIIGEESELTSDVDFSLVATTYGTEEQHLGSVGIFGPSRMEYERVIPLVDYLGEKLSNALQATASGLR